MKYKTTLIRYLIHLLHPQTFSFLPKFFTKNQIMLFTTCMLESKTNKMNRPRFHFLERYRDREFNDFAISDDTCATDDREYPDMLEKSHYFEPIFRIEKILNKEFKTHLKLNREGYIYSSKGLNFDEWIAFIKKYMPWVFIK